MQYAKDSFYLTIRDRLAALDPERKVVVDGVERPAVLVAENEPVNAAPPLPNAYYLSWSAPQIVAGSERAARPLMKLECRVAYRAASTLAAGVDRGRALTALDTELLRLLTPPRAPKLNTTLTPAQPLGTNIFWGDPIFESTTTNTTVAPPFRPGLAEGGGVFDRVAKLTILFFPEVEA